MNPVLAIDTSTRTGSVAFRGANGDVANETFVSDRSHNSQLFAPLHRILNDGGGIAALQGGRVIVGTGPGSYTGIRVGIAAAQALGLAAGIPVVGAPSAGAAAIDADDYWLCGDARRGGYFLIEVVARRSDRAVELGDRVAIGAKVRDLSRAGEAVVTFDPIAPFSGVGLAWPDACRLADHAPGGEGHGGSIEPIYLRAPFITQPKH